MQIIFGTSSERGHPVRIERFLSVRKLLIEFDDEFYRAFLDCFGNLCGQDVRALTE
ncbi:MAG TPA: hypothetical protein VNI84_00315 [Pyrinomonadaceae bacterium]|nr:hypothetical protein [Pyrinomonadaceae bacterium]